MRLFMRLLESIKPSGHFSTSVCCVVSSMVKMWGRRRKSHYQSDYKHPQLEKQLMARCNLTSSGIHPTSHNEITLCWSCFLHYYVLQLFLYSTFQNHSEMWSWYKYHQFSVWNDDRCTLIRHRMLHEALWWPSNWRDSPVVFDSLAQRW